MRLKKEMVLELANKESVDELCEIAGKKGDRWDDE